MDKQDNLDTATGVIFGVVIGLALWAVLAACTWAVLQPNTVQEADFTDSGVGCVDDCLEVASK